MRIIYMGTPEFAIPGLKILLENHYTIAAVVTAPDKPRGRGQQISFTPVKELALSHQLLVLQPQHLKDPGFVSTVVDLAPDLIIVVAFRILPKEIFTIPRYGSFNLHASLLPRYRGAAPINWAIMDGQQETGVTSFLLRETVDTGSILLQARVRIGADETAGELHDKLSLIGAEIVLQTVRLFELGKAHPRPQDDTLATPAPKIFRENCKIEWNNSAERVFDFVRGLSPLPCAWTVHEGRILRIYRSAVVQSTDSPSKVPGTLITVTKNQLVVACAQGALSIIEIQQEGKKRMSIEDFLRGYKLEAGTILG
jgi:methionyl-tRNA formyltransferase